MPFSVFSYGSLITQPQFEYKTFVNGFIRGYRRVFYQGSTDHRGTPESPGRVVTLLPDPAGIVWGRCYTVEDTAEKEAEIMAYLEWREKQFDIREYVPVYSSLEGSDASAPAVERALVFIASEDRSRNPNYLGPASDEEIALTIAFNVGPSGKYCRNCDYLFGVADGLRQIGASDPHVFSLERRVRALQAEAEAAASARAAAAAAAAATVLTAELELVGAASAAVATATAFIASAHAREGKGLVSVAEAGLVGVEVGSGGSGPGQGTFEARSGSGSP